MQSRPSSALQEAQPSAAAAAKLSELSLETIVHAGIYLFPRRSAGSQINQPWDDFEPGIWKQQGLPVPIKSAIFFLSKYSARFRLSFQVFIYFFLGGAAPRPFWKPSPMLYLLHRIMPCSILWDFFFLCFSENPAVTEQAKTKRECWWQGVHWRPQNCGVHATFPQGCMENLRGLFSSTALNRCLLPHFLCNLAAGFKSGIELLRNASEPKTASDLSLLPFPVPIWEQSSYQCSAASAPVPPIRDNRLLHLPVSAEQFWCPVP